MSIYAALLVSVNVYAVDVSEFDIKGIKLGMSKSEVLKNMPCSNPKIEKYNVNTIKGKIVFITTIECSSTSNTYYATLNRKEILYKFSRNIKFDVQPNYSKIRNKLLQHYGTTNYITFKSYNNNMGICWGNCMHWDGAFYRTKKS